MPSHVLSWVTADCAFALRVLICIPQHLLRMSVDDSETIHYLLSKKEESSIYQEMSQGSSISFISLPHSFMTSSLLLTRIRRCFGIRWRNAREMTERSTSPMGSFRLFRWLCAVVFFVGATILIASRIGQEEEVPQKPPPSKEVLREIERQPSSRTEVAELPDEVVELSPTPRAHRRSVHVSIVIVISNGTDTSEYDSALNSVKCYAALHRYKLVIADDNEYGHICKHKDPMFRRHCVVAHLLSLEPADAVFLFLDADVMVVNPERLIEEFISEDSDVILYDRFYNWEVAAGSYIVRKSSTALRFHREFADYEFRLPDDAFHGTDNGALHMTNNRGRMLMMLLLEWILPPNTPEISMCRRLWENSTNYDGLFRFEACVRWAVGVRHFFRDHRLSIVHKGSGWLRDIWLTSSGWSREGDFLLHGIKKGAELSDVTARKHVNSWSAERVPIMNKQKYVNPLVKPLKLSTCASGREVWCYRAASIITQAERKTRLLAYEEHVLRQQLAMTADIANYTTTLFI